MGMYSVDYFISDFANRTWNNMECIKMYNSRYEVTQLINSLFGLLIVPNEKYKYRNNNPQKVPDRVFKAESEFYQCLKREFDRLEKEKRYFNNYSTKNMMSENVTHLRNALAHSGKEGLHFLPMKVNSEITDIIFYDTDDEGHEFCVQLTIEEVHKIANMISRMYRTIEMTRPEVTVEMYQEKLEKYKKLMGQ